MGTVNTSVYRNTYIPQGLDNWLTAEARRQKRSRNNLICAILLEYQERMVSRVGQPGPECDEKLGEVGGD